MLPLPTLPLLNPSFNPIWRRGKGGGGEGGGETGGGVNESGESGYEKRDSSPSPCILLLQDIDILTGTPGQPHHPGPQEPLVTFTARAREQSLLGIVPTEKGHVKDPSKVQDPSRKKTLQRL